MRQRGLDETADSESLSWKESFESRRLRIVSSFVGVREESIFGEGRSKREKESYSRNFAKKRTLLLKSTFHTSESEMIRELVESPVYETWNLSWNYAVYRHRYSHLLSRNDSEWSSQEVSKEVLVWGEKSWYTNVSFNVNLLCLSRSIARSNHSSLVCICIIVLRMLKMSKHQHRSARVTIYLCGTYISKNDPLDVTTTSVRARMCRWHFSSPHVWGTKRFTASAKHI